MKNNQFFFFFYSEDELHETDDRKFIIYASCLKILLAICWICGAPCRVLIKLKKGTAVTLEILCTKMHRRVWCSQPSHNGMPEGNLNLAAGIFYSGCSPVKALNMLKFAKIQGISRTTYLCIQKSYLIPAIHNVWEKEQYILLSMLQQEGSKISVGGDGRCDSPGHSAKYGSYSLLDVKKGLILTTSLV